MELNTTAPFEEQQSELFRLRGTICTAWLRRESVRISIVEAGIDTGQHGVLTLRPSAAGMVAERREAGTVSEWGLDKDGNPESTPQEWGSTKTFDVMDLVRPGSTELAAPSEANCAAAERGLLIPRLRSSKVFSTAQW